MAGSSSTALSVLSPPSIPKTGSSKTDPCETRVSVSMRRNPRSISIGFGAESQGKRGSTRLNAVGLTEIEPDINEDPKDRWATNGVSAVRTFWGYVAEDYAAVEPPSGFQGFISWLFPPAIVAGMYFHAPGEYLYIGAAVFTVVFCIIEMNKPSEPHNFEPQIYNMERGARDKLIADYNTMDLWDFNEKYGDLWDFTVKKDAAEIMKR
ncbi:hypothetical protein RHGRI_012221 [Rhododendron griersonianum]|uniref:NAD(P)H dehydrogenase 18 n=1 Tax=Rhododendron griersonianum TaxID=479676 RepID=A0AAV6KQ73_9ERIC|nr:hypothetical protein RHGRI_012221 [Rhododendron griersonianum]